MFDERMILHRYKATSHAAMAGALVAGFLSLRALYRGEGLRKDLFAILCAMAVTKIAALVYFRLRD
ncbi:hypothetical protein METEAL_20570 [Mesoterricola silvestris]|uniref:Uncharacterized protein n=2 Tax=Mesoterricola silvestris TaxID=2927979 RepID=A0AA48GYV0_9BACT|nr:hypothetical protein METEAL_20570 [Mesoterricola silvestris]